MASAEGAVVGNDVEVEDSASMRNDLAGDLGTVISKQVDKLSNKPLQRTWACQLSVDGQRAGAARLNRWTAGAARPRQCYYRRSRNGPRR